MCGIVGFIQKDSVTSNWEHVLNSMAEQIAHRGPDSSGTWFDVESGIGLAHRRLAIIDLSPEGHQPMQSASGRYMIVFNGEIYNYQKLMDELATSGHHFRGHSDTEVVLQAIETWGLKEAVTRCIGMFAIAVWDKHQRRLYLVRDRLGEKPLYYGKVGKAFAFASELKALKPHPDWEGAIDNNALTLYMKHGYVPAPHSIYSGIKKLTPGSILSVDFSSLDTVINESSYWCMSDVVHKGQTNPLSGSDEDMISGLEGLLLDSVKQQMVADVPLGAFLSGGIDSSTVVALMQSMSSKPVQTFSIGFDYEGYDEAGYARQVAQYLGTDHTELYVTADDAINVIPKLPLIYDEPFADSSQIPTYLVSELTRQHVTVSLSGDGGDELFCGYTRYFMVNNIWRKLSLLPIIIRRAVANMIIKTPVSRLDALFQWLNPLFSKYSQAGRVGDKLKKSAYLLNAVDADEFYSLFTTNRVDVDGMLILKNHDQAPVETLKDNIWLSSSSSVSKMMYKDTMQYLPDDILVKVDRATMANSLESRIPLLDHRIVEYAWRLPLSVKYRNGQGKWILRQVLNKYVPEKYFERPKMGFGVPMDNWLKGPLRDWGEDLLDENNLRQQGYFNADVIRRKWTEHLQGSRNWRSQLWSVLVFQAWLNNQ